MHIGAVFLSEVTFFAILPTSEKDLFIFTALFYTNEMNCYLYNVAATKRNVFADSKRSEQKQLVNNTGSMYGL